MLIEQIWHFMLIKAWDNSMGPDELNTNTTAIMPSNPDLAPTHENASMHAASMEGTGADPVAVADDVYDEHMDVPAEDDNEDADMEPSVDIVPQAHHDARAAGAQSPADQDADFKLSESDEQRSNGDEENESVYTESSAAPSVSLHT